MDSNADARYGQNDPFGEDFFIPPHPEELRARAQQVRQDNQDAVRHYVELVLWGMLDRPDLARLLVAVFWLWEDIDTEWLSEACYMSVRDTIEVAEAESPIAFNCLDCGIELPIGGRQLLIDRLRSYKVFHKGETQGTPRSLLCAGCVTRKNQDDERQQTLDQKRHQAILRDYRKGSYAERRTKEEWRMLKKEVHSRDGYRCRMCNRKDLPIHLHHRTYVGYAEEKLENLITLCEECHFLFHAHSKVS